MHFGSLYRCFLPVSVRFRQYFHNAHRYPVDTPLTWYTFENLEALNLSFKFEVNTTYGRWVMAACLIKLQKWRVWGGKIRKSIFGRRDHQASIKIRTMLYFSNICAEVRWNKIFGIFTWFHFSKTPFFTVSSCSHAHRQGTSN